MLKVEVLKFLFRVYLNDDHKVSFFRLEKKLRGYTLSEESSFASEKGILTLWKLYI